MLMDEKFSRPSMARITRISVPLPLPPSPYSMKIFCSGFPVISTVGSGAALDQSAQLATYAADPSGKIPLGCLVVDMVDKDLTQFYLNRHKREVQKGQKVPIASVGWVRTNMIEGSVTSQGTAYLGHSGRVCASNIGGASYTAPVVGRFEATPDEDGYAKVTFNLPV